MERDPWTSWRGKLPNHGRSSKVSPRVTKFLQRASVANFGGPHNWVFRRIAAPRKQKHVAKSDLNASLTCPLGGQRRSDPQSHGTNITELA